MGGHAARRQQEGLCLCLRARRAALRESQVQSDEGGFSETGEAGFGYDPLFIPAGYDISFGQFSAEAKNAISHRGRALIKLAKQLEEDPA